MSMGASLGRLLRSRYVEQLKLIRPNYTRIDTVVRSTDYDRTLQTSESVLQQLFPPGSGPAGGLTDLRLQPVPEHTEAADNDVLLRAWASSTCSRFADASAQEEKAHAGAWAEQDQKLAPIRDALSKATGLPTDALTVGNIYVVADTALCNKDHQYPLPAGFTEEMFRITSEVGDWSLAHLFNTTQQQQLAAGRLVGDLLQRAQAAKAGQPQPGFDPSSFAPNAAGVDPRAATGPRLTLYSAHDATLVALLQAMGAYDGVHPPYASSVAMELWSTNVAAPAPASALRRAQAGPAEGVAGSAASPAGVAAGAQAVAGRRAASRMESLMREVDAGNPLAHIQDDAQLAGVASAPGEGGFGGEDKGVAAQTYYYIRLYYNKDSGRGVGFNDTYIVSPKLCAGEPGNSPGVPSDASCSLDCLVRATQEVVVNTDAQAQALCAHPPARHSNALTARSFDFTALAAACAVSLALGALLVGALLPACGCRCPKGPTEDERMAASFGGGAYASMG